MAYETWGHGPDGTYVVVYKVEQDVHVTYKFFDLYDDDEITGEQGARNFARGLSVSCLLLRATCNETIMVEEYHANTTDKPSNTCDCCKVREARPIHVCVYSEEIGDGSRMCNCCEECTYQCAMDI
jgi:hypothetical protein